VRNQYGSAQGVAGASIGGLGVLAEAGAIFGGTASATAEADFFDTLTVTGTGIGTFLIDTSMDVSANRGQTAETHLSSAR